MKLSVMMSLVWALALLPAVGCGDDTSTEPVCEAGSRTTCPCTGGREGFQICRADGTGYDACVCDPGSDGGDDTGTGVDTGPGDATPD